MEYYTIKQLADEFNVTKQAIRYQITSKKLQNFTSKQNINGIDTLVVNSKGYYEIKKAYKNNDSKTFTGKLTSKKTSKDDHFTSKKASEGNEFTSKDILFEKERTLLLLIKENESLHNEIKQLHTELQHEQELHLMDQKQVKQLENELKQLKQPTKETDTKNLNNESNKEKATKKWWQFWK